MRDSVAKFAIEQEAERLDTVFEAMYAMEHPMPSWPKYSASRKPKVRKTAAKTRPARR